MYKHTRARNIFWHVESFKGYGFGFKRVDVFSKLLDECQEILDIKDPDSKTWLERRKQRLDLEDSDFNSDHYLCDLFEAEDLEHLWDSESTWSKGSPFLRLYDMARSTLIAGGKNCIIPLSIFFWILIYTMLAECTVHLTWWLTQLPVTKVFNWYKRTRAVLLMDTVVVFTGF